MHIHLYEKLFSLCAAVGVVVCCLPPFSPDLSPIELYFEAVKSFKKPRTHAFILSYSSDSKSDFLHCGYSFGKLDIDALFYGLPILANLLKILLTMPILKGDR